MYNIVTVVRDVKGVKTEQKMLFGTGRLTNDPPQLMEVGEKKSKLLRGSKEHKFSIAFDAGKDKAVFFPLNVWEKNAEQLANLGFKGQLVEVAGRIENQPYKNSAGQEVDNEVLVIERFDVKQYKPRDGQSANGAGSSSTNSGTTANSAASQPETVLAGGSPVSNDDDIPF